MSILDLEKEILEIDSQISKLKEERKKIKALIPRKAPVIVIKEFEAIVEHDLFSGGYYLLPLGEVEGFSPYSQAKLLQKETKWNKKNLPKKGDKVLATIRYTKSGYNKIRILKILSRADSSNV